MNKKLLLFLLPLLFLIPKNTLAKATTVSFSGTEYFYTSSNVVSHNIQTFALSNLPTYTFYGITNGSGTFNSWASPFNVNEEGFYDISFLTYSENVWSNNIYPNNISIFDGANYNQVCQSSLSAPYSSSGLTASGTLLLNVKCENVFLQKKQYYMVTNYSFPVQYKGALGHTALSFVKKTEEQAIVDSLEKTNETLKDDNVDGANSSASSFFNDFSTTDQGGISGIVKAPLVAINKMLDNSCSPLTATYEGKEISLPCGSVFWSKLGSLKTFINLTYGGILCYLIAVKLFKLVNNLKNPNDDKVEVMDL